MFRRLLICSWLIAFVSVAWASGTAAPSAAQQDPDFSIQGEYVGDQKAMQVIARGNGEFDVVVFEGGLPGAGARPNPRLLEADAETIEGLIESMKLTRIERKSSTLGLAPPPNAVALFDGTQASVERNWIQGKLHEDGWLSAGTTSKQTFRDYQLHLEFRTPWAPLETGQKRGNSGVYHQGRFETQILDSFGLQGLNNEAGGIYEISAPSVNACFPPMTWQTYDIDFVSARYDDKGNKVADARLTVRLNGILVQNDVVVPRATRASMLAEGPENGPIHLQDHGDPVHYRNVWVVPRDADRESRRPIVSGFERFVGSSSTSLAEAGHLLLSNLACNACHSNVSLPASIIPDQHGPDLTNVAGRVRHDALVAMIADPHATKPNTTMPDPWPGLDENARQQNAAKIASYLILKGRGQIVDRPIGQETIDRGKELYHRVGCVACHSSLDDDATTTSMSGSVPMGQIHLKYSAPSLAEFLLRANHIRPGLRMPALVGNASDAFAIAGFLTQSVTRSEKRGRFTRTVYRGQWNQLPDFGTLSQTEATETDGLEIEDIRPQNQFAAVFEGKISIEADGDYQFILRSDDGSRLRIAEHELTNDGIHPADDREATFALKTGIHPIRVEYFDGGGQIELKLDVVGPQFGRENISAYLIDSKDNATVIDMLPSQFKPNPSMVQQGEALFQSARCANCHQFGGDSNDANPSVASQTKVQLEEIEKGCMSDSVTSPSVDYQLGSMQKTAIKAALEQLSEVEYSIAAPRQLHLVMGALNCYACHVRDGVGGPDSVRDSFFVSTTPEMGEEGRLPPSLHGVGDKLNEQHLSLVLDQGAAERSYMLTRMPAFSRETLAPMIATIVETDRVEESNTFVNNSSIEEIVINGRTLCGDEGLSCIKCHSFGGDKGGGLGAIDMLQMPQRLRKSWFIRYLQDPTKYRPGTRMPNSFVDGRSAIIDIHDGNPELQIDAMWQYLSLGDQAKKPSGLNPAAIVLKPTDRPRIYRNFFSELSPRGIGVAYPNKVNLIWDAERMSLARVWKNEFIDASLHWVGRGSGSQSPQGDAIVSLESSTPVAKLNSINDPWPTMSARDAGYRFLGYRLDKQGNPAFSYQLGANRIEDYVIPVENGLERHLKIDANEDLVVQLAFGDVQTGQEGYRIDGRLDMKVEGAEFQSVSIDGKTGLRTLIPAGIEHHIIQTIRW